MSTLTVQEHHGGMVSDLAFPAVRGLLEKHLYGRAIQGKPASGKLEDDHEGTK